MNKKQSGIYLPKNDAGYIVLAETTIEALKAQPSVIPIGNYADEVEATLGEFYQHTLDLTRAKDGVATARVREKNAAATLRTGVKSGVNLLKDVLGAHASEQWDVAQMPSGHVRVPRNKPQLLRIVKALEQYLELKPEQAIQARDFTSAYYKAAHDSYMEAKAGLAAAKGARKGAAEQRSATMRRLKSKLRLVRMHLRENGADAATYAAFGLRSPESVSVPEQVAGFALVLNQPGHVEIAWEPAVRATRYRVFVKGPNSGDKPEPVATVRDPRVVLSHLVSGVNYEVIVRAANSAGDGPASEPVPVTAA